MKYQYDIEQIKTQANVVDIISLQKMEDLDVIKCEETDVPMLNIDLDQLQKGDLSFIKKLGLTISNPDTDRPVALGVDYVDNSWGHKVSDFFSSDTEDDDDNDDDFFSPGGGFSGGDSFGVSFGGFGGGSFSGGGASGSF